MTAPYVTTTVVVVPVDCSHHACDLPGWDWLWVLLWTLGAFGVFGVIALLLLWFFD